MQTYIVFLSRPEVSVMEIGSPCIASKSLLGFCVSMIQSLFDFEVVMSLHIFLFLLVVLLGHLISTIFHFLQQKLN